MPFTNYSARILGTGLICGALLVYQILSARLLGLVIEPSVIIFTISISMLGMGAATSLMSLRRFRAGAAGARLGWLAGALGLSYIATFAMVASLNDAFNTALESAVDVGGRQAYFTIVLTTLYTKMGVVGAIRGVTLSSSAACQSFPLNRPRWLGGNIQYNPVDASNFIDNTAANPRQ